MCRPARQESASWLGEDYWGHGMASEILEALVDFMDTQTDIEQLTATVYA
ncbi:MAG: GNAT family N-acetyltransferase [Pseudodesulfovibrio sp.]|nr:GNAT family N-acetyltransferase [Pseudodesulfovibrio sp.]